MYTFISFCHADESRAAGFFLVTDHKDRHNGTTCLTAL